MAAMQFHPTQDAFDQAISGGKPQLVYTKLVNDLETPVSAMLKLKQEGKPAFLLESVEGGESRGRYSIIGLEPDQMWRCRGNNAEISKTPPFSEDSFEPTYDDSISSLKKLARSIEMEIPDTLPPMAAGLIGFMAYDMVKLMERLPDSNADALGLPDSCFIRPTVVLIFDSVDGVVYLIAPVWPDSNTDYSQATKRLSEIASRLRGPLDQRFYHQVYEKTPLAFESNVSEAEYHKMVERAKEYILAGDIFQVVPSQRFSTPFTLPPFSLYRSLRRMNPSPFLFYLDFGSFTLVGSSPEILVRVRDGQITIRPIAGTRKRGKTAEEDRALEEDLLGDPKEVAEHQMLLDLGRNDVGRVAKVGTVEVTEEMVIEHYSHVMHIVSNVQGELDEKYDAIDALIAGFPAGTVSGAPKIRAMEIIDELENTRRGFYAGGTGYISANGSLDVCINLRTALIKDGMLYAQAGGGVVADSDPAAEYAESVNKAQAIMRAAEEAEGYSS
ncbi:MAG: anthranilate synthase component I [Rickettsiales bacterium]|nr:anthranilate synthase component I [Rickettsiales bacterium]